MSAADYVGQTRTRRADPEGRMTHYQWDALTPEERWRRFRETPLGRHPEITDLPYPPDPEALVFVCHHNAFMELHERVALRTTPAAQDPMAREYAICSAHARAVNAWLATRGAMFIAQQKYARERRAAGDPQYTPPPEPGQER